MGSVSRDCEHDVLLVLGLTLCSGASTRTTAMAKARQSRRLCAALPLALMRAPTERRRVLM